ITEEAFQVHRERPLIDQLQKTVATLLAHRDCASLALLALPLALLRLEFAPLLLVASVAFLDLRGEFGGCLRDLDRDRREPRCEITWLRLAPQAFPLCDVVGRTRSHR